jgi:hypothetical protein
MMPPIRAIVHAAFEDFRSNGDVLAASDFKISFLIRAFEHQMDGFLEKGGRMAIRMLSGAPWKQER